MSWKLTTLAALAAALLTANHLALGQATAPASTAAPDEVHPSPPVIPDRQFALADYGAVGDGKTFNTDAFKSAVDAIAKAGGGHLNVPAGIFLTKSFALTSHMDLHLERGAIIKAPTKFSDYGLPDPGQRLATTTGPATTPASAAPAAAEAPEAEAAAATPAPGAPPAAAGRGAGRGGARGGAARGGAGGARPIPALITGANLTDVSITGSGTIDGSGEMFWLFASGAASRYMPAPRPVYPRPVLVSVRGDRLLFDGVTLQNSPMFHLTPSGQDILIQNIHIVAPSDAPNTDAMDIRGRRIVVRKCLIDVGDDDVEIGGACHDILVEDVTCLHGHGISIGSPTIGGVGQVMVRRCTFNGSENAIRIKSYRGRGGLIEGVTYRDIEITNITKRPIDINMLYSGTRAAVPDAINVPEMRDIHLINVNISHSPMAGRIIGLPEKLATDITLENVKIEADTGMQVQDATNVHFKNVTMDIASGPPTTLDNATVDWPH